MHSDSIVRITSTGRIQSLLLRMFSLFLSRLWKNPGELIFTKPLEAVHVFCFHWWLLRCSMIKSSWCYSLGTKKPLWKVGVLETPGNASPGSAQPLKSCAPLQGTVIKMEESPLSLDFESFPSTFYQSHFSSFPLPDIKHSLFNEFRHLKSPNMVLMLTDFSFLLYKNLYDKNIQMA